MTFYFQNYKILTFLKNFENTSENQKNKGILDNWFKNIIKKNGNLPSKLEKWDLIQKCKKMKNLIKNSKKCHEQNVPNTQSHICKFHNDQQNNRKKLFENRKQSPQVGKE